RLLFGVRGMRAPDVRGRGEAALLWTFNALSAPYRVFIMIVLTLIVARQYLTVGLVLAAAIVPVLLVWPAPKAGGYLASSPQLVGHRARAVGVTTLLVGGAGVLIAGVPVPSAAYAPGLVEPRAAAPVRAGADGFLREVLATPGALVE